MKLTFNADLKVAGLGLVPWTRLGPEQWLSQYKIASLYGWGLGPDARPQVLALSDRGDIPALKKMNTTSMLETQEFQSILENELADYAFLTYKKVTVPATLAHRKFLMADERFARIFENKVSFRQQFGSQLRFPDYDVYTRDELNGGQEAYDAIRNGRESFVLQDEQLGGGKGTFIIRSHADWQKALIGLEKISAHTRVVVSTLVDSPRERSIQGCVTKHGVFTGPLQRQFVAHPLLANMRVVEGDKYCGAQIMGSDNDTETHIEAARVAQIVGKRLASEGYRGIFGVDFLLDGSDTLYTLEVNPRITGVTPLLAAMFADEAGVPFYLLHILELGKYEYEIIDASTNFNRDGALLVLHTQQDQTTEIVSMPRSGTYEVVNDDLRFVSRNITFSQLKQGQLILQEYLPPGMHVWPGGRVMTILWNDVLIDSKTDTWYNKKLEIINRIHEQITYKEA